MVLDVRSCCLTAVLILVYKCQDKSAVPMASNVCPLTAAGVRCSDDSPWRCAAILLRYSRSLQVLCRAEPAIQSAAVVWMGSQDERTKGQCLHDGGSGARAVHPGPAGRRLRCTAFLTQQSRDRVEVCRKTVPWLLEFVLIVRKIS